MKDLSPAVQNALTAAADPFKLLTTVGAFTVSTVRLAPALAQAYYGSSQKKRNIDLAMVD